MKNFNSNFYINYHERFSYVNKNFENSKIEKKWSFFLFTSEISFGYEFVTIDRYQIIFDF